jgi:hypothetical protein
LDETHASILTCDQVSILEDFCNLGDNPHSYKLWVDSVGPASAFCSAQVALRIHLSHKHRKLQSLNLRKQLSALNLRHETIDLASVGKRFLGKRTDFEKKEEAIADILTDTSTMACHDEGLCVRLLVNALAGETMADLLLDYEHYYRQHQWPHAFYSMMRPIFLNAYPGSILDAQREACISKIARSLEQQLESPDHLLRLAQPLKKAHFGQFEVLQSRAAFVIALHQALPSTLWANYVRICFDIGHQTQGWPDITAVTNGSVRFIEVKCHDKLQLSQIDWLANVAEPLGLDASVLIARLTPHVDVPPPLENGGKDRRKCESVMMGGGGSPHGTLERRSLHPSFRDGWLSSVASLVGAYRR